MVDGYGLRCIWSYNLLCIIFEGDILSQYVLWNFVYGCGVSMWRSGGFGSLANLSNVCKV